MPDLLCTTVQFSPWRLEAGARPLNKNFAVDGSDDTSGGITLPDAGSKQDLFTLSVVNSVKVTAHGVED